MHTLHSRVIHTSNKIVHILQLTVIVTCNRLSKSTQHGVQKQNKADQLNSRVSSACGRCLKGVKSTFYYSTLQTGHSKWQLLCLCVQKNYFDIINELWCNQKCINISLSGSPPLHHELSEVHIGRSYIAQWIGTVCNCSSSPSKCKHSQCNVVNLSPSCSACSHVRTKI